jgi:ADP-heptose:LPS heptosyltransferase
MVKSAKLPHNLERIIIVRALHLGDLLCAVPAFRALRHFYPRAEIALVGLDWAQGFVGRYSHYLDRFWRFPGYPGMLEKEVDPKKTLDFLKAVQRENYDLAIQMHGDGLASSPFTLLLGAKVTLGYYRQGFANPGLDFALPSSQEDSEILRNLKLLRRIGIESCETSVDFPLTKEDEKELLALEKEFKFPSGKALVGIHPGARAASRRWSPANFAQLADQLAERYDAQLIITGSKEEAAMVNQVSSYMKKSAINLAGRTSLGALAALIAKLSLFVGNDTGPAHLAYALGTKSVTIFGDSDPRRWASLNRADHKIIYKEGRIEAVGVGEVLGLVEKLISNRKFRGVYEKVKDSDLAYSW